VAAWHARYGSWWAVQWGWCPGPVNLGLHVELRGRRTGREGVRYGPYADLHLPFCVISAGVRPIYAGELDLLVSYARGGLNADPD
jgi:hypothetical protein